MKNPVSALRAVGLLEGVSFLLLVLVAMPLKYLWGWPWAVKVVGWGHGVLFVGFCLQLVWTAWRAQWPVGRGMLVFVASLVPFGPFLLDRRMLAYREEFATRFHQADEPGRAKAN